MSNGRFAFGARAPRRGTRSGRGSCASTTSIGWGAWVGVGALVLVNVVLIGLLVGRPDAPAEEIASPGLINEPIPTPTPSASPSPSPSAEPEPEPPATAPGQYVLAAVSDTTAWRATTGTCPDAAATPERTTDAGANWQGSDATTATGITAVQRLITSSADQVALIGYQADGCAPTLVRSFVGGEEYSAADGELAAAWYVPADDRSTVHAPSAGFGPAPCASVVTLAAASNTAAAVLCDDATVFATADVASTFTGGVAIAGAQAIASSSDGWLVAILAVDDCPGVAIGSLDAAATSMQLVGCFPTDEPADALAGRVALSNGAGTLWMWAGDQLGRSQSNGASWL